MTQIILNGFGRKRQIPQIATAMMFGTTDSADYTDLIC